MNGVGGRFRHARGQSAAVVQQQCDRWIFLSLSGPEAGGLTSEYKERFFRVMGLCHKKTSIDLSTAATACGFLDATLR